MRVCLASTSTREWMKPMLFKVPFLLESFYYIQPWQTPMIHETTRFFMLDSGAFTFMTSHKGDDVDWNAYVSRYAAYVKENRVDNFFELDIDSVIGYDRVKELRRQLEREADAPCIPVWHRGRGKEEFIRLCKDYDYVAIGGIVSKELPPETWAHFPWFIQQAHRNNTQIHGLGFTPITGMLEKCHFDSVDSTAWLSGGRFGTAFRFDANTGRLVSVKRPVNKRANMKAIDTHNLTQWLRFMEYAERCL